MPVGRALFKITLLKVGVGVINQGHCMDILSVTGIMSYNWVFIHIQLSLFLVTFRSLYATDLAVEYVNKLKCKREERTH